MMTAVPAVAPVTTPVAEPIDTAMALLLHVPPVVALSRSLVAPKHIALLPVIVAGAGLTVIDLTATQPVFTVNVMFVTPSETPVTRPEETPTVATDGVLLVHETPPDVVLLTTVAAPTHMLAAPDMALGSALMTMFLVAMQPEGTV